MTWTTFVRVIALLTLASFATLAPDLAFLFGRQGVISTSGLAATRPPEWLSLWSFIEPSSPHATTLFFALVACLAVAMGLLYWKPESIVISLLANFVVIIYIDSTRLVAYGAYDFLRVSLFYALVLAVANSKFQQERLGFLKPEHAELAFRIHIALGYFFAGLNKSTGPHWWSGESMWRALNHQGDSGAWLADLSWLAQIPYSFAIMGVGVVVLETAYPLAFFSKLRRPICCGVIAMHAGIMIFQGLWFFGAIMICLNLFFMGPISKEPPAVDEPNPWMPSPSASTKSSS